MAFERLCCDAVDDPEVSRNLPENLPKALKKKGAAVDWKASPWNEVNRVRKTRVKYIHGDCSTADLIADLRIAEDAITHLREGSKQLYHLVGKDCPPWVNSDDVPATLGGSSAWATGVFAGADSDPNAWTIKAVHGDAEWGGCRLLSDDDPWPHVEQLVAHVRVPISGVRIYRGKSLWQDIEIRLRGGSC